MTTSDSTTLTACDRVIDENDITGVIVSVVHGIATILPDYAKGDIGYVYLIHVSRLEAHS